MEQQQFEVRFSLMAPRRIDGPPGLSGDDAAYEHTTRSVIVVCDDDEVNARAWALMLCEKSGAKDMVIEKVERRRFVGSVLVD